LGSSHAISEIVRRHIGAAGIVVSHRGARVFRHGFAARMVEQGHSLKAVADVLGHRHPGTTFLYTKVDFPALEAVPLPWPEEDER
jgi:site-specific recombinase XerD